MRFLGVFLKVVAIILLLAITIGCTVATVMIGVVQDVPEAFWVVPLIWLGCMFVVLNILGTGMALTNVAKLKKKVQLLEQKIASTPVIPAAAAQPIAPAATEPVVNDPAAAPVEPIVTPSVEKPTETDAPSSAKAHTPGLKKWLPAVIAGGAAIVVLIIVLLASGGKDTPKNPSQLNGGQNTTPQAEPQEPTPEGSDAILSDAIPVELGGVIKHSAFVMTFDSLELADEFSFETSEYSSTSLFVEPGYKLLMVRGHFENYHTESISSNSFAFTALVNGTYALEGHDVRMDFMRSNSFEIDPYTDFDYVLYINIPEKLAEIFETVTFTISFNDDLSFPMTTWHGDGTKTVDADTHYSFTGSLGGGSGENGEVIAPNESENPMISLGETIYTNDYEFTLLNVELTYEVLPPNTSSVYTSYAAESGKVYVHVEADVKNTMQRDIRIDELFTASVLYDGKYPYEGFTIVNDGDNRFDWVSSYVAATPLETCRAHSLVECPVEVDESGMPVLVKLTLGDTVYEYPLR